MTYLLESGLALLTCLNITDCGKNDTLWISKDLHGFLSFWISCNCSSWSPELPYRESGVSMHRSHIKPKLWEKTLEDGMNLRRGTGEGAPTQQIRG